jgi:hypothetical protein
MLMGDIGERARKVAAGHIEVKLGADPTETMLDAARLLRALEINMLEGRLFAPNDRGEDLEEAWITSDERHYVIPRISPLAPREGKPFLRRALLKCRVIPTRIGDFRVRLHPSSAKLGAAEADAERSGPVRRYGAAFFPGLKAKLSPGSGDFLVEKLLGIDPLPAIDAHIDQARAEECRTIVWGELSIADTSLEHLQERLASEALDHETPFRYLVAGSWHGDQNGKMRNVASILDNGGDLLFEIFKFAKFEIGGRREAIVPGNEVHVLICEDELVTIAVCRDFLDKDQKHIPFESLNVDVAIVPSMIPAIAGDGSMDKTMAGHAATAQTMRVRFGTRTFVVAQPARPGKAGTGLVMGFPGEPLLDRPILVMGPWHRCDLESS